MRRWKPSPVGHLLVDEFGEFPPITGIEAYVLLGPYHRDAVDLSGQLTRYAWLRREGLMQL